MYWENIYVILAENLSLADTDKPEAATYLKVCVRAIAEITSEDDGSLIARTFLEEVFKIYIYWREHLTLFNTHVKILANNINKFTIKNYGGNLTSFVNNLNWTCGGVPYQWAIWADNAGFDTSEWIICS